MGLRAEGIDGDWRLESLKPSRVLAGQLKEKIREAHEHLAKSLEKLETVHVSRLGQSEEQRLALRKRHAPRLARLSMESLALKVPFSAPDHAWG